MSAVDLLTLPACRWRDLRGAALSCRSPKYVAPPNPVSAEFCGRCPYTDHAPSAMPPWDFLGPVASSVAIAVGTLHTPEIAEYAALTAPVLADYARRHGYTAVIAPRRLDPSRPPAWSKLVLVEAFLSANPACRWFLWVDADALVTNPARRVEEFIDDRSDFVVAEDVPPSPINTGVFLVRNCPAVHELLRQAYARVRYIHHPWWEQAALAEVLRASAPAVRTRVVSRQAFNAYAHEHRPGDFILHFAGAAHAVKVAGLRAAAAQCRAAARGP